MPPTFAEKNVRRFERGYLNKTVHPDNARVGVGHDLGPGLVARGLWVGAEFWGFSFFKASLENSRLSVQNVTQL